MGDGDVIGVRRLFQLLENEGLSCYFWKRCLCAGPPERDLLV
jgi:hypothetical protein